MPLLGAGVLAIWNGVTPGADADFADWHVREHMPERLAVPGFLRGRRYVAIDGHPAYFNFYETQSPATLTSAAYLARLNDPSPWTRRVIAQFRDTSRTVCDVAASHGAGEGGVMETVEMSAGGGAQVAGIDAGFLKPLLSAPGIVAVHLLRGRLQDSAGGTAEKKLRGQPDAVAEWVLLIEAIGPEAIRAARAGAASDGMLARAGAAPGSRRGIYSFQFGLRAAQGDVA
jgi:hypothetical protein